MAYPGGKSGAGVYQTLINLMPPHEVYIEPFVGGGAVLRLKRPARLNIGIDLDPAALEMARRPGESKIYSPKPARLPAVSPEMAMSAETVRNGDDRRRRSPKLAMGTCSPKPAMLATIVKSGVVRSTLAASTDGRPILFEFLQRDGIEFLESYPFTGAELVYCDPPYMMSTRSGRRLYRFEMSDLQHRRLLRVLRKIPGPVMISGYWSELYGRALEGWNSLNFQAMTRGGRPATEHVWFNFAIPVALHDYRFLGSNFRERERINRKKKRWLNRLRTMPALERQALLAAIADS